MPGGSYERYGLTGNPFRDLTSDGLADVEVFHVNLQVDDALRTIKEEVFDKENRAMVALAGSHGTGKTHRLRLAQAEAKERGAFSVYLDLPEKASLILPIVAHEFLAAKPLGGLSKIFSAPAWYREMAALEKVKGPAYDPGRTAAILARALNENAPSFLLLNDLQNTARMPDGESFAKTLQELSDDLKPGALVMFGCYPSFLVNLTKNRPAFASRINRTILLPTLSIEEASLLLAKKLLAKRIVENLDPLYPFDREAVAALNTASYGNPRRLVELADRALEFAVEHRSYRVDAETVTAALPSVRPLDLAAAAAPLSQALAAEPARPSSPDRRPSPAR